MVDSTVIVTILYNVYNIEPQLISFIIEVNMHVGKRIVQLRISRSILIKILIDRDVTVGCSGCCCKCITVYGESRSAVLKFPLRTCRTVYSTVAKTR